MKRREFLLSLAAFAAMPVVAQPEMGEDPLYLSLPKIEVRHGSIERWVGFEDIPDLPDRDNYKVRVSFYALLDGEWKEFSQVFSYELEPGSNLLPVLTIVKTDYGFRPLSVNLAPNGGMPQPWGPVGETLVIGPGHPNFIIRTFQEVCEEEGHWDYID